MKSLFKVLSKILLGILAVPVVLYLLLLACNLRDDPLDPELEKLLAYDPPQIATADNGYFAWIGMLGPEAQEPHAWGSRWLQEALRADRRPLAEANGSELAIDKEKREPELKSNALPCFKLDGCLAAVAAQPAAVRTTLDKARLTLERGDKAMDYRDYQEPWRPDASLASPLAPIPHIWRHLSATRFALAVAEGQHEQALDRLGREIAFHTRQLQGSHSLFDKMVAISCLRADYQLLSLYIQAYPAKAKEHGERLLVLLAPLPKEASSLQPVLLTEMQLMTRMFLSLKEGQGASSTAALLSAAGGDGLLGMFGSFLAAPLLLPKAAANEHAHLVRPWLAVDGLRDAAYRQAIAANDAKLAEAAADTYALRNPVGHIFSAIAIPDYKPYFFKRDDLLALRAATVFQLGLLRQGATDAEAVAQAVASAETLVHPYTGNRPVWDKTERTLSYAAASARENKPLVLRF